MQGSSTSYPDWRRFIAGALSPLCPACGWAGGCCSVGRILSGSLFGVTVASAGARSRGGAIQFVNAFSLELRVSR